MSDTMRPRRRKRRAVMYRDLARRDDKRARKVRLEIEDEQRQARAHLERWKRQEA